MVTGGGTTPQNAPQDAGEWFNQQITGLQTGVVGGGGGIGQAMSATSDPLLAPVYMGGEHPASSLNGKHIPGAMGGLNVPASDGTTTVGDAYDEFHRMSDAERKAFAKKLERLGILEPGSYGYGDLAGLWREAVDEAADIYRASGRKVTPVGYLSLLKQSGMGVGTGPGEKFDGKDTFNDTENVNSTQTNLSTHADARARLRDAFQSELGRDPTRRETRVFTRALNAKERSNPSHTTGTRSNSGTRITKKNGNTSSSSSSTDNTTTTGGVGQEFDANYVDDHYDAEKDARNAAGPYYDALLGLAGGGS